MFAVIYCTVIYVHCHFIPLKEPKPTFALDYNYARRKAGSSAPGSKTIAHLWELGGDISEPKLLEVPLTANYLSSAAVVVVCDLSKPQNCLASLLKWIVTVRAVIKQRIGDLQSTNATAATAMKENAVAQYRELAPEPDAARARPCEIPLYVVANKYDTFKNNPNRRTLMQIIRFIAHFHGATVITASSADAVLKESFRSTMNAICFRTSSKSVYEASVDKAVQISAGRDSFESILLGTVRDGDSSAGGKSRLASSESDFSLYLSSSSVTRDCWDRMGEILSGLLGPPDPSAVKDKGAEEEESKEQQQNEYPEAEIDEVRAQRDAALQRYIVVRTHILY